MSPDAWLQVALAELADHVAEVPGPGSNPRIVEYDSATTLKATDDQVAWCSAFACWVMEKAGIPSTKSAMARSWLSWGEVLDQPRFGAITVLARGVPGSNQGHVGFYCGRRVSSILLLAGNQGDAVSLEWMHIDRVIGFRWPKETP